MGMVSILKSLQLFQLYNDLKDLHVVSEICPALGVHSYPDQSEKSI